MKYKGTLIVVKDCDKALKFYQEMFGLELLKDNDGNMELSGGLFLQEEKYWESFIDKSIAKQSNSTELYFEEEDIDAFYKKLKKHYPKTIFVNTPSNTNWKQRIIRFYDLDGNLIEVGSLIKPQRKASIKFLDVIQNKDDDKAYEETKKIIRESNKSNKYYRYLFEIADLLNNSKSYIRTRAFMICCAQARWDVDDKLEEFLPSMLKLLHDDKPTVVRQCLSALKNLVEYKPNTKGRIKKELSKMDIKKYKENMSSLIQKDIDSLLELINHNGGN